MLRRYRKAEHIRATLALHRSTVSMAFMIPSAAKALVPEAGHSHTNSRGVGAASVRTHPSGGRGFNLRAIGKTMSR